MKISNININVKSFIVASNRFISLASDSSDILFVGEDDNLFMLLEDKGRFPNNEDLLFISWPQRDSTLSMDSSKRNEKGHIVWSTPIGVVPKASYSIVGVIERNR